MKTRSSNARFNGIAGIIAGLLVVSAVITFVSGDYMHWLPIPLGIGVALMAIPPINH